MQCLVLLPGAKLGGYSSKRLPKHFKKLVREGALNSEGSPLLPSRSPHIWTGDVESLRSFERRLDKVVETSGAGDVYGGVLPEIGLPRLHECASSRPRNAATKCFKDVFTKCFKGVFAKCFNCVFAKCFKCIRAKVLR